MIVGSRLGVRPGRVSGVALLAPRTQRGRNPLSPRARSTALGTGSIARAHNASFFVVHHMQRLSKAAVVLDAKAIKKGAISLKQQACHVRPAAVMGAMNGEHMPLLIERHVLSSLPFTGPEGSMASA
eukprot:scaffold7098_cov124-Isochrysis_galbana.AAC.2